MEDSSKKGRTVILVSHNMSTIDTLCSRCLLLEQGELNMQGQTRDVIQNYLKDLKQTSSLNHKHTGQNAEIKISCKKEQIFSYDDITFSIKIHSFEYLDEPKVTLTFFDEFNAKLLSLHSHTQSNKRWNFSGLKELSVTWKRNYLAPGKYKVQVFMESSQDIEHLMP